MKLEEGTYARTKNNGICKLYREFHEDSVDVGIGVFPEIDGFFIDKEEISYIEKEDIIKSSKNIIDLIEVGDYVNGRPVFINEYGYLEQTCINADGDVYYETLRVENIKDIVTKEQYENNCYRIEE